MGNPTASDQELERVVRRGLAGGFGGDPGAVASPLVEAVVHGRGRLDELERVTAEAFGDRRPLELLLFDTDQIADWVFESQRPPVLEGASAILRGLNERIHSEMDESVVFSAGGEGLLLVPAGEAAAARLRIEDLYRRESAGALTVSSAHATFAPGDFIAAEGEDELREGARVVRGSQAVLGRLRDQVRRVKEARLPPHERVEGHLPRCASCRDRAGSHPAEALRAELRGELLCSPCQLRWTAGKARIAGRSFDELIDGFARSIQGGGAEEQAGAGAARLRYLGFLYADGNGMGALFGRLRSLAELRFLSHAVSGVFDRMAELARVRVAQLAGRTGDQRPLLTLLGGGDEAIWIAPAALALDLAVQLPHWLAQESDRVEGLNALLERYGADRLTVGCGLVLADSGYPVRYQHALAKRLQNSAKRLGYGHPNGAVSSLDFEVITDGEPLAEDLEDARRVTYGTEEPGFLRTCRPYLYDNFVKVVEDLREAKQSGVAGSQLYSLQAGAAEGRAVFLNFLLYQLARKATGARYEQWLGRCGVSLAERAQVESYFVRPSAALGTSGTVGTWIPDALQLAPFVRLVTDLEEKRHAAVGD